MIYNILKPVEGELLSGWLLRNIKANDFLDTKSNSMSMAKKFLGGGNTFPDLLWPKCSDGLLKNKLLENLNLLLNDIYVINKMTVIPFYNSFVHNPKYFETTADYKEYFKKMDMKILSNNGSYTNWVYICPECVKENSEIILYREHQVVGNVVCSKHGCELQYMKYSDYVTAIYTENKPKEIYQTNLCRNEIEIGKAISGMIHEIFSEGFQVPLSVIYEKLLHKMYVGNKEMYEGNYSWSDFYETYKTIFDLEYLKEFVSAHEGRNLLKKCFLGRSDKQDDLKNPVLLLILIHKVFGTLNNLYNYTYPLGFEKWINREEQYHTINYYYNKSRKEFMEKHLILGVFDRYAILKDLIEDTILLVDRGYASLEEKPEHSYTSFEFKYKECFIEQNVEKEPIKYLSDINFRYKHNLSTYALNVLIGEGYVDVLYLGYENRLLRDDFFFTDSLKKELYTKYNWFYEEFNPIELILT